MKASLLAIVVVALVSTALLCPPARADSNEDLLTRSRVLVAAAEWDAVLVLSKRAIDADPFCEPARLNETLALTMLGRWDELERAAESLVTLYPAQGWGWVRLGLARFHTNDLAGARSAYVQARGMSDVKGYALLGLGFTARARGDRPEADALCGEAAFFLGEHAPGVTECLRRPARALAVSSSVWGSFAGYPDYFSRLSVWSAATEVELRWSTGPALKLGFAYSQTDLRFFETFHQVMPSIGFAWRAEDWWLKSAYTFVWRSGIGDGRAEALEHVAELSGGAFVGDVGLGLQVATIASEDLTQIQLSPVVSWGRSQETVTVWLRGFLSWRSDAMRHNDTRWKASVGAGLTVRPVEGLSLRAAGWYGRRQEHIDPGAAWFWNTDDILAGGWEIGATVRLHGPLSTVLRFTHDFGVEQGDKEFDFHLLTAHLGLVLTL